MNYNYLKIIGLMTGTSMDGIDISMVECNGINLKRLNKNYFHKYNKETKDFLKSTANKNIELNLKIKDFLDNVITDEHFKALNNFGVIDDCDLLGFHGQTIYHEPQKKISGIKMLCLSLDLLT